MRSNRIFDAGNDRTIDRVKSGLFLYYLARAHQRLSNREVRHRKTELAVKRLNRIDTPVLRKHIDGLRGHLDEALTREKHIQDHQKSEESVHHTLKHKVTQLESKLGRYLDSQEVRKKRIEQLEKKIQHRFQTKKETIGHLRADIQRMTKLYHQLKKDKKHSSSDLLRVARKIQQLQDRVRLLV